MNMSESIQELAAALAKAQGQMPIAKKDSSAHHGKYTRFEDLVRLAKPILEANGLAVMFSVGRFEEEWMMVGILSHSSGEWISVSYPFSITKDGPQGVGAGNTYAKRYCYSNLVGIVSEDDSLNDPDDIRYQTTEHEKPKLPINPNKRISEKQQDWILKILNHDRGLLSILLKSYNYSDVEQFTMGEFDEARERAQKIRQMSQKSDAQEQSEIK
jgi:hypothetical protein